jgi:cytochrome c oxidase cbb3-type subunit 3
MPSWKSLPAQDVADILAYIRLWRNEPPSFESVKEVLKARSGHSLVSEGRQLYGHYCSSCHGLKGEGGVGLNLSTDDLLRVVDDHFLYRTTVEGRPSTAMPAWRHLSSEVLAAVFSYIRSWQDGNPIKLRRLAPTGDYIAGEAHYRISCERCHGDRGSGGVGPQITNEIFLDSVTDEQLFRWISHGRSGTAMKGFSPEAQGPSSLTTDQIVDVIAYVRFAGRGGEIPLRRIGEGDLALGATLFKGSCASCHGRLGEGSTGPQLNNPTFLNAASDGFLSSTIILGREGTAMRSMVHGQQGLGQIPVDQVQDVVAYIRTWEHPDAHRAVGRTEEMSEWAIAEGRDLYARYCSGCHGADGRGTKDGPDHYAPALNNEDFLAAISDGFLLATVARGRRGTPMRPFGKGAGGIVSLEMEEIRYIVSFLRSWHKDAHRKERLASAGGSIP